ncbi:MAG TPA: cytochrome P450 [Terriglobales bacterium]|nr:cytochrome P450 [Terriglobales bacterium]
MKDPRFTKNRQTLPAGKQAWMPGIFRPLTKNMLDSDPPDHTRLRGLVQKAFTPAVVEALRQRIEELTDELLRLALTRRQFDLIAEYALPLPTTIIAELIGVPAEDRHRFHGWSAKVVSLSPTAGPEMMFALPAVVAFLRYIRKQIRARREHTSADLLSALVAAEEAGDRLSEDELVAMIFLLLIAGHETTVNLIANGTLALIENPTEVEKLRTNGSLMKPAVEEMLRYYSPVELATERWAREDIRFENTVIPRGELVFAGLGSANRDSEQFEDAHVFKADREPNRHLAFGHGPHYCLGAPLARLEAQVAFTTLLRRLPKLVLITRRESLRWRKGLVLRGLETLPLATDHRAL